MVRAGRHRSRTEVLSGFYGWGGGAKIVIWCRDVPQPRQRLAFLLWPDSAEGQTQTNLRKVLHNRAVRCRTRTA